MKSTFKVDPAITFDHMHTEEDNHSVSHHKLSNNVLLFVMELVTIGALLGFMILLMN
jgi:hypothetical protein